MTYSSASYNYIGKGIGFPVGVNIQGNLQTSSEIRNIEESIRIILGTKLGERVYRPNFGCSLNELTFAPMNTTTLLQIRIAVQIALETWEPRIVIDKIDTETDYNQDKVNIIINYHPLDSYDSRSLVYPFYLNT
ncbi:GPW/gp25 family protein [Gloeothece citriformis PCC 7424]|uniref:GPW/gp25 family protein n=2 Tax=Gloeothece TaxID=28070 RepID=B7KB51_GLOC7|nr:GPW/gp25 family protein [Gloeothece citriformis PCC 7424]